MRGPDIIRHRAVHPKLRVTNLVLCLVAAFLIMGTLFFLYFRSLQSPQDLGQILSEAKRFAGKNATYCGQDIYHQSGISKDVDACMANALKRNESFFGYMEKQEVVPSIRSLFRGTEVNCHVVAVNAKGTGQLWQSKRLGQESVRQLRIWQTQRLTKMMFNKYGPPYFQYE